jgi:hypothetical protein
VGLLTSGAMINVMVLPRWSLGAQLQRQSGVWVGGLRQRRFFNPEADRTHFFAGFEENLVTFDIDGVSGRGWTVGASLGIVRFLTPRLALELDAGPVHIDLSESADRAVNRGMDFVANAGIAWHWGGR